ncbi:MAG: iron ABC transporter permease [Candidatus Anammoximicrobium sp.]|nr:iron ABC transporter permease [Candidatus Anammoximicrobium sp.]
MLRHRSRSLLVLAFACLAAAAVLLRDDPRQLLLLRNTLLLAAGSCAVSLPLGTALAFLLWRTDVPGRRGALALTAGLLLVPLYLQAAAWDAGWGQLGWYSLARGPSATPWLSGWHGAIWVHSLAAVPWVVLLVGAAAAAVEPEQEEDALLAGATWQVFTRVTLPRLTAGIAVAAAWVLLATATEMTVTDLFCVRTYAEELYTGFALGDSLAGAWRTAAPGMLAGAALVLVAVAAAWQAAPMLQTPQRPARDYRLRQARLAAGAAVLLCGLLVAGIPLANLVGKAGLVVQQVGEVRVRQWSASRFGDVVSSGAWSFRQELCWTVLIGSLAATCAVACGAGLAWWARRGGWRAAPALIVAAAGLALPGPLIGLGVIWLLDREGPEVLIWLYDRTVLAPVLAIAVRVLPLALLGCWYVLRSVAEDALDSAACEGAGGWSRFWRVALPQRRAGLAAVWLAVFAAAAGDLACSVLVVPPGVTTVPIRVFGLIHAGVDDQVAGLCLLVFAGLAAVVGAAAWLLGRQRQS